MSADEPVALATGCEAVGVEWILLHTVHPANGCLQISGQRPVNTIQLGSVFDIIQSRAGATKFAVSIRAAKHNKYNKRSVHKDCQKKRHLVAEK